MSYNGRVQTKILNARMKALDIIELSEDYDGGFPETNFMEDIVDKAMTALKKGTPGMEIPLANFKWSGEGSGRAFHDLLPKIVPHIIGVIEAYVVWEGGDSMSAFRIENGVMEECDFEIVIKRRKK